jgi:uncharacterized protein (DUF2141 family)
MGQDIRQKAKGRTHRPPALATAACVSALCLLPFALTTVIAQQPRDGGAAVSGSGVIAGVVVSDDAATQPVRRALVTISGSGLPSSRTAITDDVGRFIIGQLPAGRFTIAVKKAAHIPGAYGAARPGRPGTALSLSAGQRAEITLKIARAAVLAGVIRDQQGDPVAGVQVAALKIPASGLISNLFSTADIVTTDDRGMYRVFGLLPGEYVVAAVPRVTGMGGIGSRSAAEMDATLSALQRQTGRGGPAIPATAPPAPLPPPTQSFNYAPTYYPGAVAFSGATRLRLAPGDERSNVDFVVAPVVTASLEGVISGAGDALSAVQLAIQVDGPRVPASFSSYPVLIQRPGESNQFKYTNLSPGRYKIMARLSSSETRVTAPRTAGISGGALTSSGGQPPSSPDTLYGVADVDITGTDVTGIVLSLERGTTLSGKVVFESSTTKPPEDLSRIRLTVSPPGGTYMSSSGGTVVGNTFNSVTPAQVRADLTFSATGIAPGSYSLRATLPADIGQIWFLQSAMFRGQDLLDVPLEITHGGDLSDIVLTFSDIRTELSGTLQSSTGAPAPEYFVVIFSADRASWTPQSRRLKTARPGTDGRFTVTDLPAGDYLIAALTDVDPDEWQNPAFLEQLVPGAIKIAIPPGGRLTQDIRVVK